MHFGVRLTSRISTPWHVLVKELSAFGVVGAINFAVDLGLFNWLHFGALALGVITAKVISTSVATTLSYFMNRHWSFSHRARTGLRREYILFFLLNAVALLIAAAVLGVAHHALGVHGALGLNLANLLGTGLGTIFRFWSYKRWVFVPTAEQARSGSRESELV